MHLKKLNNDFFVAGQIGFSDLKAIADQGIKSLICARPDDEEGNQPLFADLTAEAEKHGIKTAHVPISPGQATPQAVQDFGQNYDQLPKPILGYCKSGMRAQTLWEKSGKAR